MPTNAEVVSRSLHSLGNSLTAMPLNSIRTHSAISAWSSESVNSCGLGVGRPLLYLLQNVLTSPFCSGLNLSRNVLNLGYMSLIRGALAAASSASSRLSASSLRARYKPIPNCCTAFLSASDTAPLNSSPKSTMSPFFVQLLDQKYQEN